MTSNFPALQTITGRNIGTGVGVFTGTNGRPDAVLEFKSLRAGVGIGLIVGPETIEIVNTDGSITFPPGEDNTASNIGSGFGLFASKSDEDLRFKSLVGAGLLTITEQPETLTLNVSAVSNISFSGSGGVVIGGTSVVTTTGNVNIGLSSTGVTPGAYTNPVLSVDAQGRITSISSGTDDRGVTSVSITGTDGIAVVGGPVTGVGGFTVGLAATGVVPGTYNAPIITVDARGRLSAVTSGMTAESIAGTNAGSGAGLYRRKTGSLLEFKSIRTSGNINVSETATEITLSGTGVTSVSLNGSDGVVVSGSTITSAGTYDIGLSTTGVTPGSYTNPTITIDPQGRITSASAGSTVVSLVNVLGTGGITVNGSPITSSGTFTIGLGASGVTAGDYTAPTMTVNAQGRITAITSNPLGEVNTAENIGTGANVYSAKLGTEFQFRTLTAGPHIMIDEFATEIMIGTAEETVELLYSDAGTDLTGGDVVVSQTAGVAVTIVDGAACDVSFAFTPRVRPPSSIVVMGQNFSTNEFSFASGSEPAFATTIIGTGPASSPSLANFTTLRMRLDPTMTRVQATTGERPRVFIVFKW